MRRWVMALVLAAAATAARAEAPPGATTCSGCHGQGGMVAITGRDPAELAATMAAFRSGARPATLMGRLARGFTPEETQAIAAWLAVQK